MTAETIETAETATDPFAELIRQISQEIQKEKAGRAALRAQAEELANEARQHRKKTVHQMLQDANDCLSALQNQSPSFVTWLKIRWLMSPRVSYGRLDANPPIGILKLFGGVVSQDSVYGQVCLVKRGDGSICVEILVQRVTRDHLEWDESALEELPVSFDQKLENLAKPEGLIEVVLRVLLDCRK